MLLKLMELKGVFNVKFSGVYWENIFSRFKQIVYKKTFLKTFVNIYKNINKLKY